MSIIRTPASLARTLGIGTLAVLAAASGQTEIARAGQPARDTIVLIGGTRGRNPGAHDHSTGIRALQAILESSPDMRAFKVRVEAYPDGWPADDAVLERAATVVWYFSGVGNHPLLDADRRARFQREIDRGVGLVAFHQASTLPADDTATPLPDWLGGARYGMFDRTIETVGFQPADHPISRGVGPFLLRDEFYPTIRFPEEQGVVPILPGTFHVGIEHGKPIPIRVEHKTAAWAFERPNGGRAFTFTGLHYLASLDHPQLRRLLLNAIAWTGGFEVPAAGIRSGVPDAAAKALAAAATQ